MSNVLITGASRGIGAAAARLFAREGWDVAIHYNRSGGKALELSGELLKLGGRAVPVQADVSDPEQAARAVREAEAALGGLDAVVCNAGTALPQQLLTDTTDEEWRRVMGADLDGVFYILRAAIPGMVRQKRGAIVTVSSMWGVTGGSCEAPYSAAKAGVIGLTKALAKELGPSHIRVNCVAPGVISTGMNRHLSPEDLEALSEETPLGRIGAPDEVAQAIWFLASDRARFLTGQVVNVDGGMVI
ncbi:MAG: 3-oxoacyl-ACP reductase FabG [Lawsonibacter sp.]|nr:3-oxoacyl-ACP reductase FabG [Lawsonibacter sp.]